MQSSFDFYIPNKNTYHASEMYNRFVIDITGTLVINDRVREWCKIPYEGHPMGCPNWNKSSKCPPQVSLLDEVFDLSKRHWFTVVAFNLDLHRKKMIQNHPNWTFRQCNCCLYWQNTVRKQLKIQCEGLTQYVPRSMYTLLPEAMGVNVFKTARRHGIMLKRNPENIVYKLALVGTLKKEVHNLTQCI
jgi:predicted metal-binding protein